jgi:hypothetical protein
MFFMNVERSVVGLHIEFVINIEGSIVEQNVTIGAQAKDVRFRVWPVMWFSKWVQMGGFGIIHFARKLKGKGADLAFAII